MLVSTSLETIARGLIASRGVAHKADISSLLQTLTPDLKAQFATNAVKIGDDCAAIPDGDGWLLFAIEGFLNEFVLSDPQFSGYCGVMVNVSDIYAMGGRPIAVVDALWSRDHAHATAIAAGLRQASSIYGVPVVGGHSNARNDREQLAVAILGRAKSLLTSFDAKPGDALLIVVDLRGRYREPSSNWDASSGVEAERLRADLELLPAIAEDGLSCAAKDISQAGVLGTILMLLECSGVGATIDIAAIPRPAHAPLDRWLLATFPSFGFILAVAPERASEVRSRFNRRDLACAVVGHCDDSNIMRLSDGDLTRDVWNLSTQALTGCGPLLTDTREVAHA
jgi:AIR synthase-related protein